MLHARRQRRGRSAARGLRVRRDGRTDRPARAAPGWCRWESCASTPSSWAPSCAAPHATRPWYGSPARRGDSGSTCGARQPSWRCPREHLRARTRRSNRRARPPVQREMQMSWPIVTRCAGTPSEELGFVLAQPVALGAGEAPTALRRSGPKCQSRPSAGAGAKSSASSSARALARAKLSIRKRSLWTTINSISGFARPSVTRTTRRARTI